QMYTLSLHDALPIFEEEAEATVMASHGFVEHAFFAVDVDRAFLAVRADEVRHGVRLAAREGVDSRHPGVQRRVGAERHVLCENEIGRAHVARSEAERGVLEERKNRDVGETEVAEEEVAFGKKR